MAKGLTLPFHVNPRGGIHMTEGPELLRQNILLGVQPATSRHPWNQNLAPREDLIFDIADSAVAGELSAHIYDLFEELKRLNMATLPKTADAMKVRIGQFNSGDVDIIITYIDLEDNKSREVRFKGGK
jgi:hypothetical protein